MRVDRRELLGSLAVAATGAWLAPRRAGAEAPPASAAPFTLPPLPWPADALEPHLDAETMAIHHGKHHAAYVAKLNEAANKALKEPEITQGIVGPGNIMGGGTPEQFLTFVNAGPLQPAVAVALGLPDAYFAGFAADLQRRRDQLVAGLADAGFEVLTPEGTYFVTADVSRLGGRDGVEFCRSLPERCGVVAVPNGAVSSMRVCPCSSTRPWSEISSACLAFCSISRMVTPRSRRSCRMRNTSCTSSGDSPIDGSSISISLGCSSNPRAISSIFCSPPGRPAPRFRRNSRSTGNN